MNHFVGITIAQELFDLTALAAFDLVQLLCAVRDQSTGNCLATRGKQIHRISDLETTLNLFDAAGQEGAIFLEQGLNGPAIKDQFTGSFERIGNPMFPRLQTLGAGQKKCPDVFSLYHPEWTLGISAIGNHRRDTGAGGNASRFVAIPPTRVSQAAPWAMPTVF